MNKTSLIVTAIIVLIVVGGGAFYGGIAYSKSQNTRPSFPGNFQGARGNRTGANGANFVSGSIISKDATSITLQLPNNNGSKIIFYSGTTQIAKTTSGTADDLTTGTTVMVTGTTNSDGSVTAQNIQIRPASVNPGGPNELTQ
jgi:hypothetical protein